MPTLLPPRDFLQTPGLPITIIRYSLCPRQFFSSVAYSDDFIFFIKSALVQLGWDEYKGI